MISIKQINKDFVDLCFELDSNTISLWNKKQWTNEFEKEGTKIFGLIFSNSLIGICVFQVVLDEAQINYFVVHQNFREKGFGSNLMRFLIKQCEELNINRLSLEVSNNNLAAKKFYTRFDFCTVGVRRSYYKDGSDALLKEKKLIKK